MTGMVSPSAPPPRKTRIRISAVVIFGGGVILVALAVANLLANMAAAGINPGFGFLIQEAGFDVSESLIPYNASDTYARVILTGLLNTLFLAGVCLSLATMIGLASGLISVGPSPIGRSLALAYVEIFRNFPKLLVLLVLFVLAVSGLPHVRQAIAIGPIYLSNRSINFPVLVWSADLSIASGALLVAVCSSLLWMRWKVRHQRKTGELLPIYPAFMPIPLAVVLILISGVPFEVSAPELRGFDFEGGARLSMQFVVIAATLAIYHGAQIAEVVRGGLQAIPKGQAEAAKALGLKRWQIQRLVVLPQVIRIIVPPMNNQYVNLIKNTSISIAVGYSDLMSVSGTIINQTFKPLEMMLLTMGIYLALCLALTTLLNRFHQRLAAREAR